MVKFKSWAWFQNQGHESRKQTQAGSWAITKLKALKTNPNTESLDGIIKEYLERKWNRTMTSSLREDWVAFLKDQGASQSLQDSLLGLLESYDFTRFASSKDGNALEDILDLSIAWVKEVEKEKMKGES